jgi:hypothetical protein
MTTKAPSPVRPAETSALETIAYQSVAGIPVADPHDRERLGYNVWRALSTKRESLEVVLRTSGVRFTITLDEAVRRIREELKSRGISG